MTFPQWDTDLFLLLNGLHCSAMDTLMWWISGNFTFVPLYVVVLFLLCWKQPPLKCLFIVLGVVLCIVLADRISSGLLKPAFHRLRPSHEPSIAGVVHILHGKAGGLYGFVSSHAANHFAFALYSLLLVRRRWYSIGIVVIAALIGYSRIYLGVHYPLDVLCGGVLGAGIGLGVYKLYCLLYRQGCRPRRPRRPRVAKVRTHK
jgi:undecaprenyl-diphosphatase